ncbi:MAG: sulfatase [Planctomycetales bacterium]|nr:sulfatase [Planctomycetales bacterium]
MLWLAAQCSWAAEPAGKLNVLLITADDLNFDSLGVTGSKTPDISPNLDRLASEGLLFARAHVNVAVCQPCRECLMTGRYPHRNGGTGFNPIRRDVPTLGESLRAAGYFQGIMAKVAHLAPQDKFCWDVVVQPQELGNGRDPALYSRHAAEFFAQAKQAGKPFFLMANSQDPHRPFAGSAQEGSRKTAAKVRRTYAPSEVAVPGFLPYLPAVRQEIAEYYTSVHRCDETVGALLQALDDAGMRDNTIVMFLSDHGMALPFAKTNCYYHSTRTPWMVRWPGKVKPGVVDDTHMIAGIDLAPTVLDALGLPPIDGVDGRSFLPLLEGKPQADRDRVFTRFHQTAGKRNYEMRAVIDARYGYIWNPWSDGQDVFRNESQSGRTFKAMQDAADDDAEIARRVKLFQLRTPQELYDYQNDPDALVNLIDDAGAQQDKRRLQKLLLEHLEAADDPLAPQFKQWLSQQRQ